MMEPVHRIDATKADPNLGRIVWDSPKASWNLGMLSAALFFGPSTFSVETLLLFLVLTYSTLLIGHSVGMHRMMIHRTFNARPLLERVLIYVGVLVGMAGPIGIIKTHDTRDWAQRNRSCHRFFNHSAAPIKDIWWQLTSRFEFDNPPILSIETKIMDSAFYGHLERYWRIHQLLAAGLLFIIGGWPYVVWGVFARVSVSVIGHWTITYFCHNPGPGNWVVKNAGVQASNIPGLGILTYGECWHNNHHAFPESARIGIEKGQSDPSWRLIQCLKHLGLVSNVGEPRPAELREDLKKADNKQINQGLSTAC
ncbi:MAG: acyl-CoA desaturase [Pseudomonadales bacterium]|nr:acyl-CoA desaturase [Pseudomonadales bacterium]